MNKISTLFSISVSIPHFIDHAAFQKEYESIANDQEALTVRLGHFPAAVKDWFVKSFKFVQKLLL